MSEHASAHQRVWLRWLGDRDELFDRVAGLLHRNAPEDAAIAELRLYPPGDGFSDDPEVVTVAWRLVYQLNGSRDWDWGHAQSEELAEALRVSFDADRR